MLDASRHKFFGRDKSPVSNIDLEQGMVVDCVLDALN